MIRLFLTVRILQHAGESLEQLEARALLYRFYVRLGMMPEVGRG